ncbi:MAG: UDP-N-acetyl glucosamine 2-epimerase [Promethearchaeota archaeon]
MELIHIVGARPQFIKMAAVSRAIAEYNRNSKMNSEELHELIVHTGQHYDYKLSEVFFDELRISKPHYDLEVGSASHGEQTGEMLKRVELVLLKEEPDVILVYGDTNTTLAGALAATKLHIPVTHVEAGLRSFNKRMPEEINRVLTDHASTILFCPTEKAVENLKREGFINIANGGRLTPLNLSGLNLDFSPDNPLVINCGDVMCDSVLYNLDLAEEKSTILQDLCLEKKGFYLSTVHRAENTDDPNRLEQIFTAFQEIATHGIKLICPLHPRTRKVLANRGMRDWSSNFKLIESVSYLDMLVLEKNAKLVLTDSGGVQKEAYFLGTPCITLRSETEWVETVEAGWNIVVGNDYSCIVQKALNMQTPQGERVMFGDGNARERILRTLENIPISRPT